MPNVAHAHGSAKLVARKALIKRRIKECNMVSNLIKKQQLFPKKKALNDLKDEREEVNANEKKALNL